MQNFRIPQDFIAVQNLVKYIKNLVLCESAFLVDNGFQSSIFTVFHKYVKVLL